MLLYFIYYKDYLRKVSDHAAILKMENAPFVRQHKASAKTQIHLFQVLAARSLGQPLAQSHSSSSTPSQRAAEAIDGKLGITDRWLETDEFQ